MSDESRRGGEQPGTGGGEGQQDFAPEAQDVPWQAPGPTPPWSAPSPSAPLPPPAGAAPPPPPPPPQAAAPPPPPAAAPPQGYTQAPQAPDPHGLAAVVGWLGWQARQQGQVALPVLAAVLSEGDRVDVVVQGMVRGQPGVAALVGDRIVLVNTRPWKPDVITVPVTATLQTQGMHHGQVATLVFTDGGVQEVVEQVNDPHLAVHLAQQVRGRSAAAGGSSPDAQLGEQPGPSTQPMPSAQPVQGDESGPPLPPPGTV